MQHHRSIGLTDLVALMAAHRSVSARQGLFDPHEAAQISAWLETRDDGAGAAIAPGQRAAQGNGQRTGAPRA